MAFVKEIYESTREMPDREKFQLIRQIRRAAVSIPSNIAEGCSRSSEKDFRRFIEIALGSAFEVETQIIIALETGQLSDESHLLLLEKLNTIQKQLSSLRNKLSN